MPYAPGIQSTAGQSIQQGLTAGTRNIASLLMNYAQKAEQSKALDGVLKAYTPEGDERDALTKALPGMSLAEKQGIVQGHAVKQALAEYGQRSKLMDAQIGNYKADNDRLDRLAQDAMRLRGAQAALPGAWQEEANMPTNYVQQNAPRRGYGMESYVAAAGRVGAPIDPHVFATYMPDRGGQPGAADFVEDDVTGSRFLKYGKQVLPSGQNPAKSRLTAVTDDSGNVIGYSDNRGRVIQPKETKSIDLTQRDKLRALQAQLGNEFDPEEKKRINKRIDALVGDGVSDQGGGGGSQGFGSSLFDDFLKSKTRR
jgi:hypothetical protein